MWFADRFFKLLLQYINDLKVDWSRINFTVWSIKNKHRVKCLFSVHFLNLFSVISYCFCLFGEFAKVFEREVWLLQVAHFHRAYLALSISPLLLFIFSFVLSYFPYFKLATLKTLVILCSTLKKEGRAFRNIGKNIFLDCVISLANFRLSFA